MLKTYNIAALLLSIDGQPIEGFGDSDAVTIAPMSDIMESYASADGETVVSATNDQRLEVTITVHQMSDAHRILGDALRLQEAALRAGQPVPTTAFFMRDPASGDQVSDQNAVIMALPESAYGKSITTREWKLLLPSGRRTQVFGANL